RGRCLRVRARSSRKLQEIDIGEYADPDDVQRVPEQGEAQVAAPDAGPESLGEELRHHRAEPQQADGDMQSVAADKREKRGEKGAAGRACAFRNHLRELTDLEIEEAEPEQARDDEG